MARGRPKGSKNAAKPDKAAGGSIGSNGYQNAQRWCEDYERHELECQQIMIDAAARCAPIKAMMGEVKKAAKQDGIGAKIFAAALLERKHLRNAAKVREKLDEELHDDLDQLRAALKPVADLPIFGAAIDAAEKRSSERQKKNAAAVDELTEGADTEAADGEDDPRPAFLKAKEQDRQNAEFLARGIKTLDS